MNISALPISGRAFCAIQRISFMQGGDKMEYRITYGEGSIQKQAVRKPQIRLKWKALLPALCALVFAVTLAVPSGRLWLRDLILPGDEEITASALENLAQNLGNGVSVGEAVAVFCDEIIYGEAD